MTTPSVRKPRLREFTVVAAPGVHLQCYDSGGPGPVVVILHGLAGSAREFFPTAAALPEFRTVLVDLRGHGDSTRCPRDLSREAFVTDVVRVIEEVAAGPVVLVGQSMGGHTAMLAAAARPEMVERLVLLEVDAGGGDPAELAALGDYFASWPASFTSREAALDVFGDGPLAHAWAADLEPYGEGFRPRFDAAVMAAAAAGLGKARWAEWESLRIPVLAVYGGKGMFRPHTKDEFVRRGHKVSRVDLPGASHDAHLDALEDWMHALRSFLDPAA